MDWVGYEVPLRGTFYSCYLDQAANPVGVLAWSLDKFGCTSTMPEQAQHCARFAQIFAQNRVYDPLCIFHALFISNR